MNERYQTDLESIKKAIDNDVKNNNRPSELYTGIGIPKHKISYLFKDLYGMTPREYIDKARYKKLEKLLRMAKNKSPLTTYQLAQEIGYPNPENVRQLVMRQKGIRLKELIAKIKSERQKGNEHTG